MKLASIILVGALLFGVASANAAELTHEERITRIEKKLFFNKDLIDNHLKRNLSVKEIICREYLEKYNERGSLKPTLLNRMKYLGCFDSGCQR